MRIALCLLLLVSAATAGEIDLSGTWQFQRDPQDVGTIPRKFTDSIHLPGTIAEAGKGEPLRIEPVLPPCPPEQLIAKHGLSFNRPRDYTNQDACLMHLYERSSYIGPAWYRRAIEIPENWAGKDVELVLERVLWESRLWVNGQYIGARNSLVTPHDYEIGGALKPGRNVLVLRIDNRRQLAIGNPHAYTVESQTIWNGVTGRMALVRRDKIRIDRMDVRPGLDQSRLKVTVAIHNGTGQPAGLQLSLQATPFAKLTGPVQAPAGDGDQVLFYPIPTNAERWSEFDPKLYRLRAELTGPGVKSQAVADFGLRDFRTAGRQFTINGQPVFLRGNVECCVFPRTGFPDMSGKQWEKIFATAKACGLNHFRFHTWCPPEAAFEVADRLGFYLEVELPNWCFELGKDPAVTAFFRDEGERMIRVYGNHPSWVMFTMGNELKGDYRVLDDLITFFRGLDPALLYDSTTYPSSKRGKVPGPLDDYYISQDTTCGRVRGQDIFNKTAPNTLTNYEYAASCVSVPLISHEVGQYCVFPALSEIPKYDGALRSVAFEAIRNDLQQKGRLTEAPVYTRDSGKLAVLLYKEEIERALRTTNQAGFQLLQLNDFPGQGTSTVGLFDSFWDSKGFVEPSEFHKFCAPVVPLLLLPKRAYQNDETLEAAVEIANFGPMPLRHCRIKWKIKGVGDGVFAADEIPIGSRLEVGRIAQPLSEIRRARRLEISVSIPGTSIFNDWSIWVYPAREEVPDSISVFDHPTEAFYEALRHGERVLLLPQQDEIRQPLAVQFAPVFWNPVMFPNQPGSMGAMIDAHHPIFADFPTDPWTDWQWWDLLHHAWAIDLDSLGPLVDAPLRFVDKFNRNAMPAGIVEAKVGPGSLVLCTLNISDDLDGRLAARQLRRSILACMSSPRFHPSRRLPEHVLRNLFTDR